ncbi:MAG: fibronectin type III domain-containing protein [Mycobacteriaceae bacterium]|nr:fibronectin type III domain-containing protein [Mycobacteriaceae bacterium]
MSKTVIDACRVFDRALEVKSGANVTVSGLTITNGDAQSGPAGANAGTFGSTGGGGTPGSGGGGILNKGTLTVVGSAVTNSHAGDGGAGGQGGPLGGSGGIGAAGGNGGGIFSSGTLTVTDSTISGNSAGAGGAGGPGTSGSTSNMQSGNGGAGGDGANGGGGGGIVNDGGQAMTITGTTISSNHSGAGGAGAVGQPSDPSAGFGGNGGNGGGGGNGAGVANAGFSASLQATNDTVFGNVAGDGGAGQNAGAGQGGNDGKPGNGGNGGTGGGLLNVIGATQLVHLTIAQNAVGNGAGGGAASQTFAAGTTGSTGIGGGLDVASGSTSLRNTLLSTNSFPGNCYGTITDAGHNLNFSPPMIGPAPPPGRCVFTSAISADPVLQALADNGGPTQTMRLGAGSAAIDKVPSAGAGCAATDQRGIPRPSGPECDIGAYEVRVPDAVTGPASSIGGSSATVSGTVTANAADASVQFQYGTSTSYGHSTAVQHVSGTTGSSLSAQLSGLTIGTTYHYRVVATSADGTGTGADRTFTAAPGISHLKVKKGKKVSYVDSNASQTSFVLQRCTRFVKHRCKRFKGVKSFSHSDRAGRNHFKLRHRLRAGRYRLMATPSFAGVQGATVTVAFKVA